MPSRASSPKSRVDSRLGISRITMADVASESGFSRMTVSYCYNQPDRVAPETLRRVMEVSAELGYRGPHPTARSLRRMHTNALGVVLGEHLVHAFDDPQTRQFLAGVTSVCLERGVGLNLIPTTGSEEDVARVRAASVDGYIVWTTVDADPVLSVLSGLKRAFAVHGGPAAAGGVVVGIDDRAAARELAALAFAGRERPGVLSFPLDRDRGPRLENGPDPDAVAFPVTRERLRGVYDYCGEAGIDVGRVPVAVVARNDRDDAAVMADALLDANPDSVLAMSDQLAFAVLDAARRRGLRVPEDLAVAGWDDGPEAERKDLTTITQSLFDQGRECALVALGGRGPGKAVAWQATVRGSTG